MKAEIILTIIWMTFCVCERQQRSTVLTDESKRVLEQFDFSNFDKQEALNYIDRQRYENQIRGKRSHSKLKRSHDGKNEKILGTELNHPQSENEQYREVKFHLNSEKIEKNDNKAEVNNLHLSESPVGDCVSPIAPVASSFRNKRRYGLEETQKPESNNEQRKSKLKRRRKKKKKKKRYWNHWNEWSPCSVTCGRGRKIRWRRCVVKDCVKGELEMGEKTCQLPACNVFSKLWGFKVFKTICKH